MTTSRRNFIRALSGLPAVGLLLKTGPVLAMPDPVREIERIAAEVIKPKPVLTSAMHLYDVQSIEVEYNVAEVVLTSGGVRRMNMGTTVIITTSSPAPLDLDGAEEVAWTIAINAHKLLVVGYVSKWEAMAHPTYYKYTIDASDLLQSEYGPADWAALGHQAAMRGTTVSHYASLLNERDLEQG